MNNKITHIAVHHHEYGVDTVYLVSCERWPTEQEIVEYVLDSEFEPDRNEYISIHDFRPDVREIPKGETRVQAS